jgi:hypothetical protein
MANAIAGRIEWQGSPRGMSRLIPAWGKEGMERAARVWHREMMPKHFTTDGARKYDYQPRSGELGPGGVPMEPPQIPNPGYRANKALGFRTTPTIANPKYAWRKRRQMRHGRELVWSGTSERAARGAVTISSRRRGDELQGLAAMPLLPKYFYQYLKAGWYQRSYIDADGNRQKTRPYVLNHNQPDKFAELTRVTGEETAILAQVVVRHLERRMAAYRAREATPAA